MNRKIIFLFLLFTSSFLFSSEFTKGKIIYYDGEIEIQRNNKILETDDIGIGFEIEEYDLIATGADGYAEIQVDSSVSDRVLIKIENNSSFYFQIKKQDEKTNFIMRLLSGNIFIKVNKMFSNSSMNVLSRSATLGVRGTEFFVTTSPEGSLLVTCPEGSVSCRSTLGEELIAGDGKIVEFLHGQQLKSRPVSDELLNDFRFEWMVERERVFRSMSFSIIKPVAIQYEELYKRFDEAYNDLKKNGKIFKKYADGKTKIPSSEIMKDKIIVSPAVIKMRGVFYIFEEYFYRVEELDRYNSQAPVKGKIRKGYSISDFMKDYEKDSKDTKKMIVFARYALKSFSAMGTPLPGGNTALEDAFSSNPFGE